VKDIPTPLIDGMLYPRIRVKEHLTIEEHKSEYQEVALVNDFFAQAEDKEVL
jgi:hypothetical protein